MKAVITVANVAAGVGKTTTAVHLAAELALRGYDTLVIDADPQADATARLVEPEAVRFSLADVLLEPERSWPCFPGERPVRLAEVLAPTRLTSLHLAPSTIRLAAAEGDDDFDVDEISRQLRSLDAPCDFAVIDTPPSLGPITAACLSASTHLLVPAAPRGQGMLGLRHLVENVRLACGHEEIRLLGVLCNLFECRDHSSGLFYEGLRREWGEQVFETIVHRDELVKACAASHVPVQALAPESKASNLYSLLADEVTARLSTVLTVGRLQSAGHAVRILVAEDDGQVMGVLREVLAAEGWEVVCCADGASALRRIESGERYDLVLTDDDLPMVTGLELVRRARPLPRRRLTPIVMFSAGDRREDALRAGADAFLRKPEAVGAVTETVANLLAASDRRA